MTTPLAVRELTPSGRGAVAVLEVRGPDALERVRAVATRAFLSIGTITLARLETPSGALDEALVCVRSGEWVELHLHGSPTLVEAVARTLGGAEGRASDAASGQVESAAELLRTSASESAARILLDQAEGALARELGRALAEDEPGLARAIEALRARSRAARFAIEPPLVVLAGPVNAGKSTLFNLLVGAERATVSEEGGTTRDALRERALLGEYAVDLVDTAGERALTGESGPEAVERAAQERAREWGRKASWVLWLRPAGTSDPQTSPEPGAPADEAFRSTVLPSRIDLLPAAARPAGGISVLADPGAARARVELLFRRTFALPAEPWEPGRGVVLGTESRLLLDAIALSPPAGRRRALADAFGARANPEHPSSRGSRG